MEIQAIGAPYDVINHHSSNSNQYPKNFKWTPSSTGLISIGRWSQSQAENIQVTLGEKPLSKFDREHNKKRYISPEKIKSLEKINFDYNFHNHLYPIQQMC